MDLQIDKSIAILPFRNLGHRPEEEYFSDGIAEELMHTLSRVEGIMVTARTSAFSFKGQNVDARDIGKKLNVRYVLEGSVRNDGSNIRVAIRLIDAESGFLVHSETYDRDMQGIFAIQDELARLIANQLKARLGTGDQKRLSTSSLSAEAYEAYLKGRHAWYKQNPEDIHQAQTFFEQAIQIAPDFALAYAGLARCFSFQGIRGQIPIAEANQKSRENALRAVEIDPDAEASHLALALVEMYAWNWDRALRAIQEAMRINPGNAEAHRTYARYLNFTGQHFQGIRQLELALRLDPLSVELNNALGDMLYTAEQFDEAVAQLQRTLRMDSNYRPAMYNLGWSYVGQKDYEKAREVFEDIYLRVGHPLKGITSMGCLHAIMGDKEAALKVIEKLRERESLEPGHSLTIDFASIYLLLDKSEEALFYLKKMYEERSGFFPYLYANSPWRKFSETPGFSELMEKTGLPEHMRRLKAGGTARAITIYTDTRETLTINLEDLLYIQAQDNYSRVVWKEKEQVKHKTLRVTLKKLESQIEDKSVMRCHKSYLVNTHAPFSVSGNAKGYKLRLKGFADAVPVSRSLGKEIVALFR